MPCSEWLSSDTRASPHDRKTSGWWFISLATGVSRFTKSTAPVKSSNLNSRRRLLPYFSQPAPSSLSLACTSSSLRTDIYSPHSMPTRSPTTRPFLSGRRLSSTCTSCRAKVRQVSYTLRYSYERPRLITWDYVDGDVNSVDGEYVFD